MRPTPLMVNKRWAAAALVGSENKSCLRAVIQALKLLVEQVEMLLQIGQQLGIEVRMLLQSVETVALLSLHVQQVVAA